jgi:hypothetical protein
MRLAPLVIASERWPDVRVGIRMKEMCGSDARSKDVDRGGRRHVRRGLREWQRAHQSVASRSSNALSAFDLCGTRSSGQSVRGRDRQYRHVVVVSGWRCGGLRGARRPNANQRRNGTDQHVRNVLRDGGHADWRSLRARPRTQLVRHERAVRSDQLYSRLICVERGLEPARVSDTRQFRRPTHRRPVRTPTDNDLTTTSASARRTR